MHCIRPQSQTTPEKTLSNPFYGKGFCEPQQYKAAIDRCEGGYQSLEIGIDMYKSLHKIFENNSAALREWSKTSIKRVAESKEYGANKKAWLNLIRAVEKYTERNNSIAEGIQQKTVDKMTAFKNEHYAKSHIHVRQIKEFEKEFKKVQRTWTDCLDKINEAKQTYHEAERKLRHAKGANDALQSDVGSSDEEKKKGAASIERRTSETKTCRTKYESILNDAKPKQQKYEEDMLAILRRTDDFERKRLDHFKSVIESLQEAILIKHEKFDETMVDAFNGALTEHKTEEDIKYFNVNYGSEKKTKWPAFEELKE